MTTKMKSSHNLSQKKVAIIGLGKIATILLQAMLREGLLSPERVHATVTHADKAAQLSKDLGIHAGTDNAAAVRGADIVLLAVKPQTVGTVLAAKVPIVRAMPNTPSLLGAGMSGICKGSNASAAHLDIAQAMFSTVGRTAIVEEKHMDAVTGLSASGPAFIYIIVESLAEAGVKVGLPRDLATLLAAQTTMGAAKVVLETGQHPAQLKDAVTTPAGCTIDGILELEEGKLRVTLIKAVVKAAQRAKELVFS